MRKLLFIVFSLMTLISVAQNPDGSGYIIYKGDTIDLKGYVRIKPPVPTGKIIRLPVANNGIYVTNVAGTLNPQPGDVLLIPTGVQINSINLQNFYGTADKPIYIKQENPNDRPGGYKAYGLSLSNAKYFILDGVHMDGKDVNVGIGIGIGTGCSDFQILNCSSVRSGIGLQIKTNPGTMESQRWMPLTKITEMRNIVIKNFYAANVGAEGIYIGYSAGLTVPEGVVPVPIRNLTMENITIENSGWDGIQITCGINFSGKNFTVRNFGTKKAGGQNSGIALQSSVTGTLDGFTVTTGHGAGLTIFGRENLTVKNGVITNVGFENSVGDGIYVADYPTDYSLGALSFRIHNVILNGYTRFPINLQNTRGTMLPGFIENFVYLNGKGTYKINNTVKSLIIGGTEGK
jgi:hypothetical protein